MPTSPRYIAFWSYTRFDDDNDGKWLTDLRSRLEAEVRSQTGKEVAIFQDVNGIGWGEQWKDRTKMAADEAVFLVPIITPSYFYSEECRAELEWFVQREEATGFRHLILPLYYISCSKLEDRFEKGADRLARIVAAHNYHDIRGFRHRDINSYEVRQEVTAVAELLISRLHEFARHQLISSKAEARIIIPAKHARVPRTPIIFGTLQVTSEWIEVWLVVEARDSYHPQRHLLRSSPAWHSTLHIGGPTQAELDADREFTAHVLAVTEDVSRAFDRYGTEASKQGKWSGVPIPPDSRVLATVKVIRDDTTSAFQFMEGTYSEFTSDGLPTGGTIRIKLKGQDSFTTEALGRAGKTEWTGSLKMFTTSDRIGGDGTYSYFGKLDSGVHLLTIELTNGDLRIEGRNTSQPTGKSFKTIWKKR